MRFITTTLAAGAVLLCVVATGTLSQTAAQIERGTLRLHYVQKAIGFERYEIAPKGEGLALTSDFDFTDRGGRVQLGAMLETRADLTPTLFRSKGRSYRFVNVDSEVRIDGHDADVRADGSERRVPVPRGFFTVDGYAPFAVQMLLLRYWERHGRPAVLQTAPGLPLNDVRIEARGTDAIHVGGRSIPVNQFVIDGVVWGRETLWLDHDDVLAAAITRAGGLAFEAVREELEPALSELVDIATRDRVHDLEQISHQMTPVHSGTFALVGATLLDMTDAPPTKDSVVLVRDGRIEAAGPRELVTIPPAAARVDVGGKTILPGLWDMHTHFTQVEWAPVYLAAGVTTVRDMGNETNFIVPVRDSIVSKRALGPHLLLAGLVDAGGPNAFGTVYAATPDESREVVRQYHDRGFQQIKIYSLVAPPIVASLSSEAHRLGMGVTGHLPNGMTIEQAVAAGMDGIAHLAIRGEAESEEVQRTIAFMRDHGTVMDPTQSWNELLGHAADSEISSFQPGFPKIPSPLQRVFASAGVQGIDAATARTRLERGLRIVRALHEAGVPVVAGTDEGIPGHSLHREIELYVEAGFSPLDALKAATIVPARVMKLDRELGTIEPGKRADLIVLDENPLEAIRNVRTVRLTIVDGKLYETAALWKSVRFRP